MNIHTEIHLTDEDVKKAITEYVRNTGVEIDPGAEIRISLYTNNGALIGMNAMNGQVTATLTSDVEP